MERQRLERVRSALLHAGPGSTVASIALENGVIHLGRFATSYRTRFGEYPSDTLARSSNR
jgi:transcriptional regulator GlxA family with amidase domain